MIWSVHQIPTFFSLHSALFEIIDNIQANEF